MNFIVSSGELFKHLQLVGGVITNSILKILENFLLELKNGKIKITGSDGETTLQTTINVISEIQEGKIAVQAKLLIEVLKTFNEQLLKFQVKNNTLEIIDQNNNCYVISLDNYDLYPSPPELIKTSYFTFYGKMLSKAISKTLFAVSNDAIRPTMTGVFFEVSNQGCNIVSTDAQRLVKYTIKEIKSNYSFNFIMPKKPLILLKNFLIDAEEFVKIEFNSKNARFSYLNFTWICRLIDGKYPNYNMVIPDENPNICRIKTAIISNAVKRASYFSNKSNNQICFKLNNNTLRILAEDINFHNKADMQISCSYLGEDLTISYNAKFLLEMISNIDTEEVLIKMSTSNRPGIIQPVLSTERNEDMLMLLMPLMV